MGRIKLMIFFFVVISSYSYSQHNYISFGPGFNALECDALLRLNQFTVDSNRASGFYENHTLLFQRKYKSDSIGLDNAWQLWIREDSTLIILLQGTTADAKSILSDFYCAMLPSTGIIHYSSTDSFSYQLAKDPRAAVHAGFMVGFSYLAKDMAPKIDSLYKKGYYNFIISGHSQGGALCYYVSAWLNYLKIQDVYPKVKVKTYASAPPKMGNSYFINDYDNVAHAEWTFSVVNSSDPVTEMPFTTQQLQIDINQPNPLIILKNQFNKAPLLKRWVLKSAFNKMERRARKSSESYQKYLGKYIGGYVKGYTPELKLPEPVKTTNFFRPGISISLMANENYYEHFEKAGKKYYNHNIESYRYLLHQYFINK